MEKRRNDPINAMLAIGVLILILSYCAMLESTSIVRAVGLDMSNIQTVKEKKLRFFSFLRPVVEKENTRILRERKQLLKSRKRFSSQRWIKELALRYGLKWKDNRDFDALLKRVDIIPLELVLVQSANESNWGQSRFALEGNNMFGQWCFSVGCGIVPKARSKNQKHEVRRFESVNESVRSYLKNINTSRAYKQLRNIRAEYRIKGEPLNAVALTNGLKSYSQRGTAYIKEIKQMIRINQPLIAKGG